MESMNILRKCYQIGVFAVQPQNLMPKWLKRHDESLKIGERIYALTDTYIVGFGKAVAGMIPHIENTLTQNGGSYIKEGIVSVPQGYLETTTSLGTTITRHPHIKLYEGAQFNLPDKAAQRTAEKIMTLSAGLCEDDLLFVLMSGGGSALLPMPISPMSLEEKTQVIKSLSLHGASISELNMVRRAISGTKGGNLAKHTKAKIVAFLLSDTMDNDLNVIASGPTVPNPNNLEDTLKVLNKYNIPISKNLNIVLQKMSEPKDFFNSNNIYNIIIGDNNTALSSIHSYIKEQNNLNCIPIILTSCLKGEASSVGISLAQLAFTILDFLCGGKCLKLEHFSESLHISSSSLNEMESIVRKLKEEKSSESFCLIFGGETTVQVQGSGRGGRNQEMVLAASLEIERMSKKTDAQGEIALLSGGTDGIDGPTDAAGAITFFTRNKTETRLQTSESVEQGLNAEVFLQDNNSYEYFSRLSHGKYLLKPGHTGTNVMDIQLLYIKGSN